MYTKLKNIKYKHYIKIITLNIIKMQIYWTIAYFICLNSFGTAYCAPAWYQFWITEKPPTIMDALSTDLSWSKIIFFVVAGFALVKGIEYSAGIGYNFCKGIYEGFTGKDIMTQEQKINFIYEYLRNNPDMFQNLNNQIQLIQEYLINIRRMEGDAFTEFSQEFANIQNMADDLNEVLLRLSTLIRNGIAIDVHQNEFTALSTQLNELRDLMLTSTQNMDRISGSMINMQNAINELDFPSQTAETQNVIRILQENMGNMQNAYTQFSEIVTNPIFAGVTAVANIRPTEPRIVEQEIPLQQPHPIHTARRPQRAGNRYDRDIVEISEPRVANPITTTSRGAAGNALTINGLQPGEYTLNVTAQGNIHIDPISSAITTVARHASQPNSLTSNLLSGVSGFMMHPDVQNAAISYGLRVLNRPQQVPQMPNMPFYPPMVPYGYFPPNSNIPQSAQNMGDFLANYSAAIGEGGGKIIGKMVGGIFKGIF